MRLSCYQCWSKPTPRQLGRYYARRHRGLGAEDRDQYNAVAGVLRESNVKLKALESQLFTLAPSMQGTGNTDFIALIKKISDARLRYNDLLKAYIYAYGIAFGPPDTAGLELGQWQVYVISGVGIAVILAAAYELYRYITGVLEPEAQAKLTQQQTASAAQQQATALQQQAAAAYAAGDTPRGDQLTAMAAQQSGIATSAGAGPGAESFTQWITRNAGWVAAGAAAVFLVPKLIR
jgi:hypothetical protein